MRDSQSLGLLRFPSPQLRQQTRLPKFPTVPLPVDFDDNVGHRIAEEDEEEEEDAEDGVVRLMRPKMSSLFWWLPSPFAHRPPPHPSTTHLTICQSGKW